MVLYSFALQFAFRAIALPTGLMPWVGRVRERQESALVRRSRGDERDELSKTASDEPDQKSFTCPNTERRCLREEDTESVYVYENIAIVFQ
jgi:hypothetical protein